MFHNDISLYCSETLLKSSPENINHLVQAIITMLTNSGYTLSKELILNYIPSFIMTTSGELVNDAINRAILDVRDNQTNVEN